MSYKKVAEHYNVKAVGGQEKYRALQLLDPYAFRFDLGGGVKAKPAPAEPAFAAFGG